MNEITLKEGSIEVKDAALSAGLVAGGFFVAGVLAKVVKQANTIGGVVLMVGGALGVWKAKPMWAKMLCLGAASYGLVRLANSAMNKLTSTPAGTSGLAGLIPDSVKEKIRQYMPTLAGDEDLLTGDDDYNMGDVNLDDMGDPGDYPVEGFPGSTNSNAYADHLAGPSGDLKSKLL